MIELEEDIVTRGRAYLDELVGRRVTVVGLAKSGVAAVLLLQAVGARVSGSDAKPMAQLTEEARGLVPPRSCEWSPTTRRGRAWPAPSSAW